MASIRSSWMLEWGSESLLPPQPQEISMRVEEESLFQFFVGPLPKIDLHKGSITQFTAEARQCDVVFVNNRVFDPSINHTIETEVLRHLEAGAVVLSTENFASKRSKLMNLRNLDSFNFFASISEETLKVGDATWTNGAVTIYTAKMRTEDEKKEIKRQLEERRKPTLKRKNEAASEGQNPSKMARMSEMPPPERLSVARKGRRSARPNTQPVWNVGRERRRGGLHRCAPN